MSAEHATFPRKDNETRDGLSSFGLDEVLLTDEYYINALTKEIEYLLTFDTDMLIAGFRDTAGIDMKGAKRYPGWETTLIGGHTLGHYLTACVQGYQSSNVPIEQKILLLDKLNQILTGLKECQDAIGTGFLFGAIILDRTNIEQQFDNVEHNLTNIFTQSWVPWYTIHKTMAGLIQAAHMKNEAMKTAELAARIASDLGDWVYNRVSRWSPQTKNTVLNIEYGGMNDCMYDLYRLTGNQKHAEAAHAFDQTELFEKVLHGKPGDHILNNYHANTTIPKFLGALNRYIMFRNEPSIDVAVYLDYARAFWDMVVSNHTYLTGGNSEWEHFGLDGILDSERTNCNCETCNAYNMQKLTKKLFMLTGDVKYADYYENTFLNSILSSQNPETGMTTYFQPMATGYFKVFGEGHTKFWCCTGTGMENFTKLGESFYYYRDDILMVNQYISSELNWAKNKLRLIQVTNIPTTDYAVFTLRTEDQDPATVTLAFRLPDWLAGKAVIRVNGNLEEYISERGYAYVAGPFADNTVIEVELPMAVRACTLPDHPSVYGLKYGPVVLSALLGTTDMEKSVTGVDVTIPLARRIEKDYTPSGDDRITVFTATVQEFISRIDEFVIRDSSSDQLVFHLTNTDARLTFVPHYSQYQERYGLYWYFVTQGDNIESSQTLKNEAERLDTVQPGYGQYENDELHQLKEYGTGSTGDTSVGTSRFANAGGAFSYRMLVNTEKGTVLQATFKKEDYGKTLRILIGSTVVYEETLLTGREEMEYQVYIPLPIHVLKDHTEMIEYNGKKRTAVTLTFEGRKGEASARLCNFLYTLQTD